LFLSAAGAGNHAAALRYGQTCLAPESGLPDVVRKGIEAEVAALTKAGAVARTPECLHTEFVPTAPPASGNAKDTAPPREVWAEEWTVATYIHDCRGRRERS